MESQEITKKGEWLLDTVEKELLEVGLQLEVEGGLRDGAAGENEEAKATGEVLSGTTARKVLERVYRHFNGVLSLNIARIPLLTTRYI